MEQWEDSGIILSLRPHGENGGIVSILTEKYGRHAGYVYGAHSKNMRGVLEQGNKVLASWSARQNDSLGTYKLELQQSQIVYVLESSLKLTALQSFCALTDQTLPEREPYPQIYAGLCALLDVFDQDIDIWGAVYVYWEMGLLQELGFGLNLSSCVSTGQTDDLIYVSPKSGCAVSRQAGEPYQDKMLSLPPFLQGKGESDLNSIIQGLEMTGYFLQHRVFSTAYKYIPDSRLRLIEKLIEQRDKKADAKAIQINRE